MQIQLSNDLIRRFIAAQGWPAPEPGKLHLLGLRGAVPLSSSLVLPVANLPNRFNDSLVVFGTELETFLGTVDPGSFWTDHPDNPLGCANVLDGAYDFELGDHKGHPALIQAGPVRVWRDLKRTGVRDPHDAVQSGYFGIHIHAQGDGPTVDEWSAGCMGPHGGWESAAWAHFYGLCTASHQQHFRVYVADGSALAAFAAG